MSRQRALYVSRCPGGWVAHASDAAVALALVVAGGSILGTAATVVLRWAGVL